MGDARSIDLRHLRAFLAVAETTSFTRAAERLGVTQPSVSIQTRELEEALKCKLFQRLGQGVTLTPAGRAFRPGAERVMEQLNDACQVVLSGEGTVGGHISVAVVPLLNVPWIPRVLGKLAREHPALAVTVIEKSSDDMELAVETGHCDLGIGILTRSSPNLGHELLREDELVLIQAADGPFGHKRAVTAEEAADTRLVVLPESYVIRQLTNQAFRAAGVVPRHVYEVDTMEAVLATVTESHLCTVMPSVVLEGRRDLGLRALRLKDWRRDFEFGVVWAGRELEGAGLVAFVDALRAVACVAGSSRSSQRTRKSKSKRMR